MKVAIVGAGIGGLTLGLALQQKNIPYQIFESAREIKPVGAGITLASNATQIYKRLGIYEKIENAGNPISAFALTDRNLKPLATNNLHKFELKYGVKNIAISRGDLQGILYGSCASENIHLGKQLARIDEYQKSLELYFADGIQKEIKWLIGADGIHSKVRETWFPPSEIRRPRQLCWRGVTNFSLKCDADILKEAWGFGTRFGFVQIATDTLYWYALANFQSDFEEENAGPYLTETFKQYHPLVRSILSATPKDAIIHNEILDLKPIDSWYRGRVCLIGDAAHATTPNMGQGAGQAVEDAFVLAECLGKFKDPLEAWLGFEEKRRTKALSIVNTSWQLGKMAHISNPVLATLRNFVMRMIPDVWGEKRNQKIFDLDY